MRLRRVRKRLGIGRPSLRAPGDAPRILVTGSSGTIGRVLAEAWPADRFTPFDLPTGDARDRDALIAAAPGHWAIVHLAWDTSGESNWNSELTPDNRRMVWEVLEAAVAAGVPRVVIASSVHADVYDHAPGQMVDPTREPVPDSPYGASKVFAEALGRYAAAKRGLEVVAIRFGGVTGGDESPVGNGEPGVWLRHRDCATLVEAAVTEPLPESGYALAVGVSENPERIHEFSSDLSWRPAPAK